MGRELIEELLNAAKTRIQTQAEFSPDAIGDVVNEVIEEFMADGLVSDDENIEVLKVELINRLKESENELAE